jgi:ribosome-associated protein
MARSHAYPAPGAMSEHVTLPVESAPADVARAAELLLERKAEDVNLLDLRGISTASDFFLIATGRSDTHVTAIADHLIEEMKARGVRPSGVEGLNAGRWVLVDYFDFVVHVFHPRRAASISWRRSGEMLRATFSAPRTVVRRADSPRLLRLPATLYLPPTRRSRRVAAPDEHERTALPARAGRS